MLGNNIELRYRAYARQTFEPPPTVESVRCNIQRWFAAMLFGEGVEFSFDNE